MSGGKRLTIGIDFDLVGPWCYIGKRNLDAARDRFAQWHQDVVVAAVWYPVQLLPDAPDQGWPFAEFYRRRLGSPEAVRQRQGQVMQAAHDAGLDIDLARIERMPNTARAHELLRRVAGVDGVLTLLTDRVDDEFLDAAGPQLRVVSNYAVGFDNIDVAACARRDVRVGNTPGVLTETTADLAWALLMAAARRLPEGTRFVRDGKWKTWGPLLLLGPDVHGATLGIVGFGRIARALAAKASAIGFRVLAFDPYLPAEAIAEAGAEPCDLPTLLAGADVVSLHAPLTPETHHLIGADELAQMREGALLVNTSRGPLVDLDALRSALGSGRIGGAALDVLENEPPAPDDPLLARDDVIVTPHAAFYSEESMAELQRKATEQVIEALAGRVPPYAVNARELGLTRD